MGYLPKEHPDLDFIDNDDGLDIDVMHLIEYPNSGKMIEGVCAHCKAVTCVPLEEGQGRCERCGYHAVCSAYKLQFG